MPTSSATASLSGSGNVEFAFSATYTQSLTLTGESGLSAPVSAPKLSSKTSEKLSGIVINQNQLAESSSHYVSADQWVYQEFILPKSFPRGNKKIQKIPDLTGLQVFVSVDEGCEKAASLDWKLEYYEPSFGWNGTSSGTSVGAAFSSSDDTPDNGVWMPIYFEPIKISSNWNKRWRLAVRGRSGSGALNQVVQYDSSYVTIGSAKVAINPNISESPLREGEYYPFDYFGTPAVLYIEPGSGTAYFSIQQGISKIWYSTPNPLELVGHCRAYSFDGVDPVKNGSDYASIMFRVLAGVADNGIDFLGNLYRSLVVKSSGENVSSGSTNKLWMSKPNPSRFAIENLYFDVRDGQDAVVIDHLLLDPATPGVWFNVYFSNDPIPGTDDKSWDNLMWEKVPQNFQANRKNLYTFPRPINAKYVKIEFSHLQAKYYAPGEFQKPMLYKKHPKWVLDYYLFVYSNQISTNKYAKRRENLSYNTLELAYQYFLDDIQSFYGSFDITNENVSQESYTKFAESQSLANQADIETLSKIKTLFRPFLNKPYEQGRVGDILYDYAYNDPTISYSTEAIVRPRALTAMVSNLDREQVVLEKNFPVMSFPISCRHKYKTASAGFFQDVGYFAGVKEIAFTRDHYSAKQDNSAYIESAGDNLNVERNDFQTVDFHWVTYATS